jgi:glycosyltransferase involved in cell wall biosynthesis
LPESPQLRIIVPAFNEATRIAPTLRDYCREFAHAATIVVVTNGCTDGTESIVRAMQSEYPELQLVDIPGKIGKGGAVSVGLASGSEPIVGYVDADGSTRAAEFRRLFDFLAQGECDAVIGSRWQPGARVDTPQPLARRLASRGFNAIVRLLFGLRVRDTQCGAKLFRRAAVRELLRALDVTGYAFDIEVLWRLNRAGYRILEVPTVWSDKRVGTKIALAHDSWAMLRSVLWLRLKGVR